jgi:uncharacterized membrane protein YdjX (TVP38/TMEM64 family)
MLPRYRKQFTTAALLFLVVVVMFLFYSDFFFRLYDELVTVFRNRNEIRESILACGMFAPIAFIALQCAQIIISPIPGEATGLLGGFLFGKWAGLLYSTAGLSLGSWAAFLLARRFRQFIKPWLLRSALYERLENIVEHQGVFVCFMLFLMPGFPKDFLCYLLGLSRMHWAVFFFISAIGRIPGTVMLSWQGADIYSGNIAGFLVLLTITIVVALPAWIFRERIYRWMEGHKLQD